MAVTRELPLTFRKRPIGRRLGPLVPVPLARLRLRLQRADRPRAAHRAAPRRVLRLERPRRQPAAASREGQGRRRQAEGLQPRRLSVRLPLAGMLARQALQREVQAAYTHASAQRREAQQMSRE